MSTTVEIDKAGRIVVPKKMRDALHLTPGTKLRIDQRGEHLTLTPSAEEARLVIRNGAPLIIPADRKNAPVLTVEDVNAISAREDEKYMRRVLGLDDEESE